ncbi:hypothetical protein FQN53_005776 [Emmonsiellopsis sp. PD_33]|nr:hypothetical protein FQN53_005776 [Emmonsiellopsis sp. PD_33]
MRIIENFRRGSADGLSLLFLVVWLLGDIFNILGAVLQGVLPTMIILAVYYTLADIVLLLQCFYYRGFTLSDKPRKPSSRSSSFASIFRSEDQEDENATATGQPSEQSPLLTNGEQPADHEGPAPAPAPAPAHPPAAPPSPTPSTTERERIFHRLHHDPHHPHSRRPSLTSFRQQISSLDGAHLSPAMPLIEPPKPTATLTPPPRRPASSTLQILAFNTFSVALVCAAGVLGWYVSVGSSRSMNNHHGGSRPPLDAQQDALTLDLWGQIFGYLCAALYLGSRIPQLLLNCRRKSTEGVSLLFFLFACVGNLTYVLSIVAFSPRCGGTHGLCREGERAEVYGRYLLVNASWLLGSLGTLVLDLGIFAQFVMYREKGVGGDEVGEGTGDGGDGERVERGE